MTSAQLSSSNSYSDQLAVMQPGKTDVRISMNRNDSELWQAFTTGNERAFVLIYKKYVDVLYNYGKKYSSDSELIKDCIQDFFVYLREKRLNLGETTSIKFYLLRAFRRRLFLYIEKTNKQRTTRMDFDLEIEDCSTQAYINQDARKYKTKILKNSLDQIKPREREAIYLYYFEELGYKEIAEIMQFTHISSARRLIYTALKDLRGVLSMSA